MKKKFFAILIAVAMVFVSLPMAYAQSVDVDSDNEATVNASQGQGQDQQQITDLNMLNNSFNSQSRRGFAIPGEVTYGPVIGHYVKPLPSEGFQPIEELILYNCWFTEGALESMLKGVEKADAEFKVASNRVLAAAPAAEDGETRWIKIVIQKGKYVGDNVAFKGFITAKSEHRDTTMTEVMAKAALEALHAGCNVIHFTAQGAVRDTEASGWGIGFNTTQAQIYNGQDMSNVSSGGLGYSSAKAGTRDKAWLQGFGLIDYNAEYPELELPVTVEDDKVTFNEEVKTIEGNQVLSNNGPQTGNHTSHGSIQ
jgi:hypothetical protein